MAVEIGQNSPCTANTCLQTNDIVVPLDATKGLDGFSYIEVIYQFGSDRSHANYWE